ncbi:MAG: alpha/beta hydrolase, partial [Eubacteriales bacterium]|nr:alpha/beta hydrolase [Eubacteriales bacterium]
MKQTVQFPVKDHVVTLAADIVYGQRQEWCEAKYRQLKLSFMKPRCHYPYDVPSTYPLVVWICGGSFIEVDRNVWMPELVDLVRHGYAVASVEYSVTSLTRFPQQLEDIKQAIRFLRAHAEELQIQPEHIAIMGESAGGYFSALTALTNHDKRYDKGEYLEQS